MLYIDKRKIYNDFGIKNDCGMEISVKKQKNREQDIRILDASDERQYLLGEDYEVYEKQGAPTGAMAFHYHNFYEIIYVLEGQYASLLDNRTYHLKKGDFLLINQNVMHKYYPGEDGEGTTSRRIILWITEKKLAELSDGKMNLSDCFREKESCAFHFPIYYEEMLQGYLLKLAGTRMQETEDAAAKLVMDRGYLTLFFVYLNVLCRRQEYFYAKEEFISHPLVEQVSEYIDSHLMETITVEELAAQIPMSKYHFLRRFKELTGMTVHSYVIQKRLIHACAKLQEGESVMEVSRECGFTDYSSFLRNFKASFGCSPRELDIF